MNETVKPPPQPERKPKSDLAIPVTGRDREFLPAALEILETPPAPVKVAVMLTICGFFAVALFWSFIGRLDVHAVAWGKIEANGRTKVIQPLDPGKVASIAVENGSRVKAGDLLVTFEASEAQADANASSDAFNASKAEVSRRRAAIDTATKAQPTPSSSGGDNSQNRRAAAIDKAPEVAFDETIPIAIQKRERAVLRADLAQLDDTLKDLDKQIAQKDTTHKKLEASIAFQQSLIGTLKERVGMREASIKLDVGTKINLFDAKEALQKSQAALASDEGQLVETDAAVDELKSQKIKVASQFSADNEGKLAEASRKADEMAQQLAKARAKLTRMKLFSPIDGVVQQVAVTTIGQVVTTGQQLMAVTPTDGALQVEAFVSNLDIGFVRQGQDAEIKVDAFPFTRFGTIHAKVVKIAADAIDEQDAKRSEANAAATANIGNSNPSTAPGQPQNFVFPVTLALDANYMTIGDAKIPLTSGMTISAEIKTDRRRVIDYLLSPLSKIGSESLTER